MYKRQIYQIAESNRIEKNRFGSENRIESNRNFFCPNWNALVVSALLRGNWQDFNWHDASRRPSAIAELLVTARRYASAVYATALCSSVSVCLSQVGVLLKRLNTGSHKQNYTIAQGFCFPTPKISAKFDRGHPLRGHQMQVDGLKSATFDK